MRHLSILAAVALTLAVTGCGTSPESFDAHFRGELTIRDVPADATRIRVWIPVPESDEFQVIDNFTTVPETRVRSQDPLYRNALAYLELEAPFENPVQVSFSYDLRRIEERASRLEEAPDDLMRRYLQPDRLGIIDKRVHDMAREATAGAGESAVAKARAIYDYVLNHMDYDKEVPGWGRGDTARACEVAKGNCSDYHSLFISLARASDIPARFHYGWALKPEGKAGPHCWAEFHDAELGWIPVDISEADKANSPEMTEFYFGSLSRNRVLLTTGRDIVLDPPQAGEPLNFLIQPHVEIDGKAHASIEVKGSHSRLGK